MHAFAGGPGCRLRLEGSLVLSLTDSMNGMFDELVTTKKQLFSALNVGITALGRYQLTLLGDRGT